MRPTKLSVLGAAAAVAALMVGSGVLLVAHAADDVPPDLPSALHGSVETQAVTAGNGALSLFVDPGTAYAYSTLDRDDYGGGSVSFTMTARGANLNLGTIAYAVLWAAPDCGNQNISCVLSGGDGTPNTGLHEAGGFPAYAEALYPPPPEENGPSRERVYKCVVNKDAAGAAPTDGAAESACRTSASIPATAWAEAIGEEIRATGFSRAAGFDQPGVLKVAGSESSSDVRNAGKGKLGSKGYSFAHGIDILGGQIHIGSSEASASVTSDASGNAKRSVACTFSGLTVAGTNVGVNDLHGESLKPLLDQVRAATQVDVKIEPPTKPVSTVVEGGKQYTECTGIRVLLTDLHGGSPVPACLPQVDPTIPQCVPSLGSRLELTFGHILVQQSVNDFPTIDAGDGAAGLLAGTGDDFGAGELASPDASGGASFEASGSPLDLGSSTAGSVATPSLASGGSAAPPYPPVAAPQLAGSSRNLGRIGALTAAAAAALLFGVWLLLGVVEALATGGPLRLPGARLF